MTREELRAPNPYAPPDESLAEHVAVGEEAVVVGVTFHPRLLPRDTRQVDAGFTGGGTLRVSKDRVVVTGMRSSPLAGTLLGGLGVLIGLAAGAFVMLNYVRSRVESALVIVPMALGIILSIVACALGGKLLARKLSSRETRAVLARAEVTPVSLEGRRLTLLSFRAPKGFIDMSVAAEDVEKARAIATLLMGDEQRARFEDLFRQMHGLGRQRH